MESMHLLVGTLKETLKSEVKWGALRRLEFIEFRLFWNGRVNRLDLGEVFGLSHQQASTDLKSYQELAPENCIYDHAQKAYVRTERFKPVLIDRETDRYLLQVMAVKSGWMSKDDTWFDQLPKLEVVGLARKPLDPKVVLAILDAIRKKQILNVDYRSMTGSPEAWRVIAPHAVSYSAGRWYARAWSSDHNDFRDYSLGRIHDVRGVFDRSGLDYEWHQKINLQIEPNPELSAERQGAVAAEHDMVGGVLEVPVRLSQSFYLMSEHNLDVERGKLLPEKQQLVLRNRKDVDDARRLARQMSKEALARGEP